MALFNAFFCGIALYGTFDGLEQKRGGFAVFCAVSFVLNGIAVLLGVSE